MANGNTTFLTKCGNAITQGLHPLHYDTIFFFFLNMEKTKEMWMTFSSQQRELAAAAVSPIHGRSVELVEEYKYMGTIFDSTFKSSGDASNDSTF